MFPSCTKSSSLYLVLQFLSHFEFLHCDQGQMLQFVNHADLPILQEENPL